MDIKTLSKIVNAVVTWSLEYNDTRILDKICTEHYIPKCGNVREIKNLIYVNGDFIDIIITLIGNGIGIYRVECENGLCIGYKPMYFVDTTNKTQIEITAEMMYCVNSNTLKR